MVGASGFEIRLERVGESLQITSAMPTSQDESRRGRTYRFHFFRGVEPREQKCSPAIILLWTLQERALASIFPGSHAHLSPKYATERTLRSVPNG